MASVINLLELLELVRAYLGIPVQNQSQDQSKSKLLTNCHTLCQEITEHILLSDMYKGKNIFKY